MRSYLRMLLAVCVGMLLLCGITGKLNLVFSANDLPEVSAVLPKDYTHTFRRPSFANINENLYLFWQTPSLGPVDKLEFTNVINGKVTTDYYQPDGLKPGTLQYGIVATGDLARKLPLKVVGGSVELQSPFRLFPNYAFLPESNASFLVVYETNYREKKVMSRPSLSFFKVKQLDNAITTEDGWTIPKRETLYLDHEDLERLKAKGMTEKQLIDHFGLPSENEINASNAYPAIARDDVNRSLLCVGINEYGVQVADQGNLWLRSGSDDGKTWTAQQIIGWGLSPTIAVRNGEVFVVATDRVREPLIPDYMWGYWPDEWTKGAAWPVLGKLMLWRWRWGEALPKEPIVVVNEPKAVQSTLAVRDDGLLVLIYAKTEFVGSTTSLWITTSQDGVRWEAPRQLTDGKFLDRDASAVFYRDTLWIAFARAEGKMPSSIYLIKYDRLPPVVDKANQETNEK